MALHFLPPCPICRDTGWYREPDPAGQGQEERCPKCNPAPPLPAMTPTRLRECLSAFQWSQRGFARVLGRDEGTVRQWARGAVRVPDDVARWLEALMRVPRPGEALGRVVE